MNHTQTPWNAYQQQDAKTGHYEPRWAIHGPGMPGIVANIHFDLTQATTTKQDTNVRANAAYIVHAVNSHEAMLGALEDLIRHNEALNKAFYGQGTAKAMRAAMSGQKDLLMKARQALAKGKGGQS